MQENESPRNPATPESTWKSMGADDVPLSMTTDDLCRKVRQRETRRIRVRWVAGLILIGCVIGFTHSVLTIDQAWIRLGWAWLYGGYGVLALTMDLRWPGRNAGEPCAAFLQREYAGKRDRLLGVRRDLILVILPAVFFSWLGGGPERGARSLGIDPASWLFHHSSGPWPFVVTGLVLAFIWHGYGKEAKKVEGEMEALRQHISN